MFSTSTEIQWQCIFWCSKLTVFILTKISNEFFISGNLPGDFFSKNIRCICHLTICLGFILPMWLFHFRPRVRVQFITFVTSVSLSRAYFLFFYFMSSWNEWKHTERNEYFISLFMMKFMIWSAVVGYWIDPLILPWRD